MINLSKKPKNLKKKTGMQKYVKYLEWIKKIKYKFI